MDNSGKAVPTGCPFAIGVLSTGAKPSRKAAEETLRILRALEERYGRKLLLVYLPASLNLDELVSNARQSGIDCRPHNQDAARTANAGEDGLNQIHLIDEVDVALVLRSLRESERSKTEIDPVDYSRKTGRPVITVDPETAVTEGSPPSELDSGWLADLFGRAGLTMQDNLKTVRDRIAAISREQKPRTTEWWIRLLTVQAIAATLPLLWLTRSFIGMGWIHALVILLTVVAMVIIAWWLRWRGMQKLWARTRLVAEIGRSIIQTQRFSIFPAFRLFGILPAVRPLRWCKLPVISPVSDISVLRDEYIKERVDVQSKYFSVDEQRQLEDRRHALNRWTSLLLDLSLAFAAIGLLAAVVQRFAQTVAGSWLEIAIAAAGVISIVALLAVQTFAAIERLNVRIATCARQRKILIRARFQLQAATSLEEVVKIVNETEQDLLQEVLEWYFTTEFGEHFYSIKPAQNRVEGVEPTRAQLIALPGFGWINRVVNRAGVVAAFVVRVLIGRVLWTVTACLLAAAWLGLTLSKSKLQDFGEFTDPAGDLWEQGQEPSHNDQGCVVFVHGMWTEPPNWRAPAQETYWPRQMAEAVGHSSAAHQRQAPRPSILILDWNTASAPSWAEGALSKSDPLGKSYDIGAIRSTAYRLGDLIAIRIEQWMNEGKIKKDRPLHLIGHSAGGYAVTRCALDLRRHDCAPPQTHITILDTPVRLPSLLGGAQDDELLEKLPKEFPDAVDFYASSELVQLNRDFEKAALERHLHFTWIGGRTGNIITDHSNAWRTFLKDIREKGLDSTTLTVRR